MKKIILSLLVMPLLFSLGSFLISQKAHAASYNLNIGTVIDNGNRNFNTTNTDHCFDGKFTVTITDASGTRTLSKDSQSNCVSSFLNTSVTLRANDPDLYELGEDYFRITLTAPNKDLNFIYIYNFSSSDTKRDGSKTANIPAGHKQIVFGIKPYCSENISTNCLKCTSNSQCSSDPTFKYCAPTTDKCSDLTTYKESLCNANNYCGTFTVGGTSLACGGCGTDKTCNTDTHKCSIIPNCTAGAKLGTCKPKNSLPKPDGGTCGPGSGTQTKTLTTKPNYSDCKEVTTTQDCAAPEAQVCRSGNCNSSNECGADIPSAAPTKDLVVSTFTFPGGVDTGTSDPTVKIKNQGNTQITGDFKVKVVNKDGGTAKVWTVSQVVSPGEVIDLSSKFTNMPRPAAGTHLANAFVDSAGNISETNEGNNFKTDSYTTTKPSTNPPSNPPTNPPSNTCDKNAPTLEITPNNRNGNPGDEKEYTVKVINNDKGASCNPVNFVLSKEHLPNDNWTGSFADNTLGNIEKNGGSKSTTFKLKSPKGATEGQKTITLGLRREGQTSAQVQVNTFYTVTADNTPTPQPTTCTRNAPEFIVTPNSLESTPGEEADYKIEITNKDTGTCSPKTLSLSAIFPNNNWQAFFGKDSPFELAKGAKQITNVRIKSPDTATPGDKKITLNIKNSNGTILASKDITYVLPGVTPTQCVQNNPEFSISPQTKNGNPGEGVTYEMTIKNIDQSECNSRTFSFQATPPSNDWSTNFSENSSSFAPGESKNINVTITSPSNISTGEHVTVLKLLENNSQLSSIVAVYNVEDQITPIPGNTYLNFKLGIDGIGTTPRIPIGGNKNPNNIWRGLNFKIYNTVTNTLSFTGTNITFTYNQSSEKFELLYDLPSLENLPNGTYNIYVNGPGFLTNQYPGSFTITQGQVTDLTSNNFYLITGNVNNNDLSENKIDLMDYNLLLSCSVYSQDRTACDQGENNEKYTDLNDDGIVNEDDYTLFLKEFASQQGVILPD